MVNMLMVNGEYTEGGGYKALKGRCLLAMGNAH